MRPTPREPSPGPVWRSNSRPSPDPLAAARALRAGEVDVMWGGPLRVMISRDADPGSDLVCFCDVVARDPFFVVGRGRAPISSWPISCR